MKIVRYRRNDDEVSYGIVSDDRIRPLKGDPFCSEICEDKEWVNLSEVRLLSPCKPSKIIALGLNYKDHALELGMELPEVPLIFIKPGTSVIGPGESIVYPGMSQRVDYEAELGVVIGRVAKNVSVEEAFDHVLGYTCFNDVTARDLQRKDGQFTRSKSFDTFAPIGPWVETEIDPGNLAVKSILNGKIRQQSSTRNLIFDVPYLVHFISSIMTLIPGDVIATGTPGGIGPMKPGDTIEIAIEGIGSLVNKVCRPESLSDVRY